MQFEPVDAGTDAELGCAGAAEAAALRFDVPTGGHQFPHGLGHRLPGKTAGHMHIGGEAHTQFPEPLDGGRFRRVVPVDVGTPLSDPQAGGRGRMQRREAVAVVGERRGPGVVACTGPGRFPEAKAEARRAVALFEGEFLIQIEVGDDGSLEQSLQNGVAVFVRKGDRLRLGELANPDDGGRVVQARQRISAEEQARAKQQFWGGEAELPGIAPQLAAKLPEIAFVAPNACPKLPGVAGIPVDRDEALARGAMVVPQPAESRQFRQHLDSLLGGQRILVTRTSVVVAVVGIAGLAAMQRKHHFGVFRVWQLECLFR